LAINKLQKLQKQERGMPNEKEEKATLVGVIGGMLAMVGLDAAWNFAKQKGTDFVKAKADEVLNGKHRGPIGADILRMPLVDTQNLRAWLARARAENKDGRIMHLLSKIDPDPDRKVGRQPELKTLNSLASYEEFLQVVEIFNHDDLLQMAKKLRNRIRENGGTILREDVHDFEQVMSALGRDVRKIGVKVGAKLNTGAGKAVPVFESFANWLEGIAAREGGN
jgi:hypothetical protein